MNDVNTDVDATEQSAEQPAEDVSEEVAENAPTGATDVAEPESIETMETPEEQTPAVDVAVKVEG